MSLSPFWHRFLWLGADPEVDPPVDPAPDPAPDAVVEDDDLPQGDLDTDLSTVPAKPDPAERATAAERRATDLERELAAERAARASQPPPPPAADPDYQREEEQLAQARSTGASTDQLSWLQWQIESNRRIRNSERSSQGALAQARDLSDKADFDRLEITKPKTYKAYRDRIEKMVADTRSKGQAVPSRMVILRLLIGDDIMNGNVKSKTAAKPAAEATTERVARPRVPVNRSDVSARATQNERDKRRERLRNQPI